MKITKTALITGASSGIGHALAIEYAKLGYNLLVIARREEKLINLINELKLINSNLKYEYLVCDITNSNDLARLKDKVDSLESLDTLIANAGIGFSKTVERMDRIHLEKMINTNVYGVFDCIKICLDKIKQNKGNIAIIGSVQSFLTFS